VVEKSRVPLSSDLMTGLFRFHDLSRAIFDPDHLIYRYALVGTFDCLLINNGTKDFKTTGGSVPYPHRIAMDMECIQSRSYEVQGLFIVWRLRGSGSGYDDSRYLTTVSLG
jgi:hypothetical protein